MKFMSIFKSDKGPRFLLIFFISGILSALPFVFPWLFLLSYISLIPIIYLLITFVSGLSKRKSYLIGLLFGYGYFGVMYYWFSCLYPMDFAGIGKLESAVLVAVCWIGLATVQALEFGFVTLIYRVINPKKKSPLISGILFILLWVLFEWQQTLGWRGVPWGRLALSQSKVPVLQQSASLLGSYFVSAVIVAVNVFLTLAIYCVFSADGRDFRERLTLSLKNKKTVIFASVAVGIFSFNLIFGALRLTVYNEKEGTPVTAAVIQGNVSSLDKWAVNATQKSADLYLDLTKWCVSESGA
jgi:apolipoprotein N-acyltransferase